MCSYCDRDDGHDWDHCAERLEDKFGSGTADLRDTESTDENSHASATLETLHNADDADLETAGIETDEDEEDQELATDGGLRPRCFAAKCDREFDSLEDMVAVPGAGDQSPRHFCEPCSERIRRGPPLTDGGQPTTGRYVWDHDDCPRDDCEGELQQQDAYNVMCLACEGVWTHYKTDSEHRLITAEEQTVASKPRVATDGGTSDSEWSFNVGTVTHVSIAADLMEYLRENPGVCAEGNTVGWRWVRHTGGEWRATDYGGQHRLSGYVNGTTLEPETVRGWLTEKPVTLLPASEAYQWGPSETTVWENAADQDVFTDADRCFYCGVSENTTDLARYETTEQGECLFCDDCHDTWERAGEIVGRAVRADGGLERFDSAILEDDGDRSIQSEASRLECDDALRLTESQAEAILEYDRAVTMTWQGRKVIVEVVPDSARNAPIEIRQAESDEKTDHDRPDDAPDCDRCEDGGDVIEAPEAGYWSCLECGARGSGTEVPIWWHNDPDSQWYVEDEDDDQELVTDGGTVPTETQQARLDVGDTRKPAAVKNSRRVTTGDLSALAMCAHRFAPADVMGWYTHEYEDVLCQWICSNAESVIARLSPHCEAKDGDLPPLHPSDDLWVGTDSESETTEQARLVTDGGHPSILKDDRNGADISDDGAYRYRLWRTWDASKPTLAWIMLNPSTADASEDDPTIRRCLGFAKDWGYGSLVAVNLFALRSTDPSNLRDHPNPVGPENDAHLRDVCEDAEQAVAAWGANGSLQGRAKAVGQMLEADLYALETTKAGHPVHPLYQPADAEPEPWDVAQLTSEADR